MQIGAQSGQLRAEVVRRQAVELVIKLMTHEAAHNWIRELAAQPEGLRWALMRAG